MNPNGSGVSFIAIDQDPSRTSTRRTVRAGMLLWSVDLCNPLPDHADKCGASTQVVVAETRFGTDRPCGAADRVPSARCR